MLISSFSGASTDNLEETKSFYRDVLGLKLKSDEMGLTFELPGGAEFFIYEKPDHKPATFTVLNLISDDITSEAKALATKGVKFDRNALGDDAKPDELGIYRGKAANMGPDIAWFKDPAGNVLSLIEN